jgi:Mg2+-importing ATPase
VESVISASIIVLVIRTRRFFLTSRPGRYLALATVAVAIAVICIPYTALGKVFGFAPLPGYFLLLLAVIVTAYVASAEVAKRIFYRRYGF